jgi:hypothetical protein
MLTVMLATAALLPGQTQNQCAEALASAQTNFNCYWGDWSQAKRDEYNADYNWEAAKASYRALRPFMKPEDVQLADTTETVGDQADGAMVSYWDQVDIDESNAYSALDQAYAAFGRGTYPTCMSFCETTQACVKDGYQNMEQMYVSYNALQAYTNYLLQILNKY